MAETAELLRVSRSLVYQLIESGRLTAHRLGSGRGAVRLKKADLIRYVDSCRDEASEPARSPVRRPSSLRHLKF
ncbi:MAG: helix-turn-helix domain-containing protein [Planctomycetia bacterium]|nr:helix-turn-helix domain-containing protein [Planctomycetia bacterium]